MKASESNAHYTGKVRECTNYAVRSIKNLFKDSDLKTRQACSKGETEMQTYFQNELEPFSDSVSVETFQVEFSSIRSTNMFVFLFMIISCATIILANFFSYVLLFISLGASLLALFSKMGLFSKIAKKKQSANIVATRKALGVAKNKVIFCANVDAPYKRGFSKGLEKILSFLTLAGILLNITYDIVLLGDTYYNFFEVPFLDIMPIFSYILIIFVPAPLVASFALNTITGTLGVANNLSGCFSCLGAMRYLSEFDLKLDNTDVCVLLTGAKNAHNAGAKAYLKEHGEEDKALNTLVVCVDTLKGANSISIQSGSSKGQKLAKVASGNANVELANANAKYLKSDAATFAKAGIASATVTTLGAIEPDFYTSDLDNVDNIDVKATESAINILLESAYLLDEKSK